MTFFFNEIKPVFQSWHLGALLHKWVLISSENDLYVHTFSHRIIISIHVQKLRK